MLEGVGKQGFQPYCSEWIARAAFLGAQFSVEVGGETLKGVFSGIHHTGAMLLNVAGEILHINTGHIVDIRGEVAGAR